MPILQSHATKTRDPETGCNLWTTELGGLNFTDLKVEQLAQHVHRLIGNVRKGGTLGNIILMAINACQLHLGTEQPFLSQDPHSFLHRQPRATSRITYIWKEL